MLISGCTRRRGRQFLGQGAAAQLLAADWLQRLVTAAPPCYGTVTALLASHLPARSLHFYGALGCIAFFCNLQIIRMV